MVPGAGAWAGFASKTPIGNHIAIDFAYETPGPTPSSPPLMNALHYKAAYWVGQGVFDSLASSVVSVGTICNLLSRVSNRKKHNRGDALFLERGTRLLKAIFW